MIISDLKKYYWVLKKINYQFNVFQVENLIRQVKLFSKFKQKVAKNYGNDFCNFHISFYLGHIFSKFTAVEMGCFVTWPFFRSAGIPLPQTKENEVRGGLGSTEVASTHKSRGQFSTLPRIFISQLLIIIDVTA